MHLFTEPEGISGIWGSGFQKGAAWVLQGPLGRKTTLATERSQGSSRCDGSSRSFWGGVTEDFPEGKVLRSSRMWFQASFQKREELGEEIEGEAGKSSSILP